MNQETDLQFTRRDANQLVPSIESVYYGLIMKGKYLPKITSSAINSEYLLNVLFDKYFVPQSDDIVIGNLLRPIKKNDIVEELLKINIDENILWGFYKKHQPDKQWAVNVLKTLKPEHNYFKKYSPEKYDIRSFTQDQLMKIKTLDVSVGKRSAVRRFFRIENEKKKERKNQLQKKIMHKDRAIKEIQKELQELGQQIQQIQ